MTKLFNILLVLSVLFVGSSCKKEVDPEPETETPGGSETADSSRYDMVDFDLDYLFSQGEDNRPKQIITLGDKIWGIATTDDQEFVLVSSDDPAGPWEIKLNNGNRLNNLVKSWDEELVIMSQSENSYLISKDQGASWTEIDGPVGSVSVSSNVILVALNTFAENGLFYSVDFGESFVKFKDGAIGTLTAVMAIDDDHYIAAFGDTTFLSSNGVDWVASSISDDFGWFTFHDYETGITYGNFDQGLWSSSDFGLTRQQLTTERVAVKGKMPNGELVASRLISGVGYEVVRSYNNGHFWLKLGGLARDGDVVSYGGNTVIAEGTGIYVLKPGVTEWDFYPIVNPQFDVRNRGTQSAEMTANQLMVSYDDRETWQVTNSFSNNVSFHTRIGYGKIAVITQTGGFFNFGATCHVLNSSGTLLEDSYSLPWTGKIDNFVSDGVYIACVFHGDRDFIGYTTDLKTWSLLDLPTDFNQIHFLQRDELGGITIGFEGKNSKDFKEFTSTNLDLLVEDGLFGEPVNNATNGWPGYYEYEEFDAVHYGKFQDSYAIFGDDMYVYSPETERWYKSKVYPTLDGIKQIILKTGFLNHSNFLISPGAVSTTAFEVEKVN